ncbi:DUF4142 domain-containing protein [Polyangium mundeleinium]|uniref:DUF4142 domain-containing protein n=1 Tax=Polyangium mundeleinium TaxID=2995306 RepID=A0ABT5EU98_9BACT|nr:DUF4142 domain-containing protein [Polyangium mundeleinium]MDC0744492.1 DUF4142 domain-containing protein [Polyangium mundeleinium]
MKKVFMVAALAAMAMSSVPVPALAETPDEEATADLSVAHDDAKFVGEAAKSNLWSVKAARLAVLLARNSKVEALALQELAEHVHVTEGIEALAEKLGVPMPTAFDPVLGNLFQRLARLRGNRFDRVYLHTVIEAHRFDVENLSQALASQDADVKAFAEKNLPVLRGHLEAAQEILRMLPGE